MGTSDAIREAVELSIKTCPFAEVSSDDGLYSAHFNIARAVTRHLAPGSTILDFGCGPCDKTAVLQALGYRCSGYDDLGAEWHRLPGTREKILEFAAWCGIEYHVAGPGPLPFQKSSFDMVLLTDVIEHLHDSPRELLNELLDVAKPEGLLLITVPNAANIKKRAKLLFGRTNLPPYGAFYWTPGPWRGHVREYVRDDLEKLSQFLGVETLELTGCDQMMQKIPPRTRPFYRAVTAVFDGWKDTWLLVARKPAGWKPQPSPLGEANSECRPDVLHG